MIFPGIPGTPEQNAVALSGNDCGIQTGMNFSENPWIFECRNGRFLWEDQDGEANLKEYPKGRFLFGLLLPARRQVRHGGGHFFPWCPGLGW